jgi:oligoribonuclease (3'-5' exoribonuclease)
MTDSQRKAMEQANDVWIDLRMAGVNSSEANILPHVERIAAALDAARVEERERCAKLCDEEEKSETAWMLKYQSSGDDNLMANCQGGAQTARELAISIRALPAPTEGEGEKRG